MLCTCHLYIWKTFIHTEDYHCIYLFVIAICHLSMETSSTSLHFISDYNILSPYANQFLEFVFFLWFIAMNLCPFIYYFIHIIIDTLHFDLCICPHCLHIFSLGNIGYTIMIPSCYLFDTLLSIYLVISFFVGNAGAMACYHSTQAFSFCLPLLEALIITRLTHSLGRPFDLGRHSAVPGATACYHGHPGIHIGPASLGGTHYVHV